MKIQMKTLYAGPAGVMEAGSTQDVSTELGTELVAAGYAVQLSAPVVPAAAVPAAPVAVIEDAIETMDAPVEPIEQAVKPRSKKK